jgi:intracellular septation protein
MQLLFDFFPVIAFYVAYKLTDIFTATAVIIVAVILQTGVQWIRHRKVSRMALISGGLVIVFGSLTLLIHDEMFIKWKVSVVNWLFGAAFLISQFVGEQPLVQRLMGGNLTLDRSLWIRLNWMWVVFFFAMGSLNLYVVYRFDTAVWAAFKLYGLLGLTLLFTLIQGFWLVKKGALQDEPVRTEP